MKVHDNLECIRVAINKHLFKQARVRWSFLLVWRSCPESEVQTNKQQDGASANKLGSSGQASLVPGAFLVPLHPQQQQQQLHCLG